MGVILTTYKSWDDPPSRTRVLFVGRFLEKCKNHWSDLKDSCGDITESTSADCSGKSGGRFLVSWMDRQLFFVVKDFFGCQRKQLGRRLGDTVDERNPKQPPGMYKTW